MGTTFQPTIKKINLHSKEDNSNQKMSELTNNYPKTVKKCLQRTAQSEIKAKRGRRSESSRPKSKVGSLKSECAKLTIQEDPDFRGKIEESEEQRVREQREQRVNVDRMVRQQKQREKQKALKHKKMLQQQLNFLQVQEMPIPYDYDTGDFIISQQARKQQVKTAGTKSNVLSMRYRCSHDNSGRFIRSPLQNYVSSTRKLTSFGKPRRRLMGDNMDQASFSNNGDRQYSSIPFVEVQQGVVMRQQSGNATENRRSDRVSSATHRSFKSYTRQKMQSTRYNKTINTAASREGTAFMGVPSESKANRSVGHSRRNSILWTSQKSTRNHKINKNPQLVDNYFQFQEGLA